MFKNLKEKAKKFWYNNKTKIVAVATGVAAVGGVVLLVYTGKKNMDLKLQEEAIEKERKDAEQKAEWEKKQAEWNSDPLNHIAGGEVADYYDASDDKFTMVEFIINDVPIDTMGDFGQELLAVAKERFPDVDDLDLAQMIIDLRRSSELKCDAETGDAA